MQAAPSVGPAGSSRPRLLLPGLSVCAVVAAAAAFLGEHYGAPVLLFALLLGMALGFLADDPRCTPGIDWCARTVLRLGVALLGLRITAEQVTALGWMPVLLVVVSVVVTIGLSMLVARALGFQAIFGLLTGGATAICGASAALALSAALPDHPLKQRATSFTVIGVSALSTMAMIGYPMVVEGLGLDPRAAGVFLGATIHDVAQVVGAGYGLSPATGDVATLTKLLRVAMLLPVIMFAASITRARSQDMPAAGRPALLPAFAVAFVALALVNSTGMIPASVQVFGNGLSRWCLVAAIAAIGMKTRLQDLAAVGPRPIVLMVGETVFLAVWVLAWMRWTA